MKLHPRGRDIILWRRERAELEALGYRLNEIRSTPHYDVIVDVKISRCGKYVYTKTEPKVRP